MTERRWYKSQVLLRWYFVWRLSLACLLWPNDLPRSFVAIASDRSIESAPCPLRPGRLAAASALVPLPAKSVEAALSYHSRKKACWAPLPAKQGTGG
jgi:hypothetical protein